MTKEIKLKEQGVEKDNASTILLPITGSSIKLHQNTYI